jgi:hypothetical protein
LQKTERKTVDVSSNNRLLFDLTALQRVKEKQMKDWTIEDVAQGAKSMARMAVAQQDEYEAAYGYSQLESAFLSVYDNFLTTMVENGLKVKLDWRLVLDTAEEAFKKEVEAMTGKLYISDRLQEAV